MSRPSSSAAVLCSDLRRLTRGERPEWVSDETWAALVVASRSADHDIAAAIAAAPDRTQAAARLGISTATLARWLAR